MEVTYEIITTDSGQAIRCLICKMISYNPNDIEQRYCGWCHQFHSIMQQWRMIDALEARETNEKLPTPDEG